ncbi:metal ABC transporter solute-binding protein, Zn/Mn family [Chitinivibrio alkaliphilus]|uniref:ABC-type metal ion transport system, periplasmic component/surface adhesin n=1 Tax=Chitinivibrio alkaliphilus ACht1 TaxID=1313304 RepID=U7D695_9BACT|nr:zinc ABC transporter substrate-binding protein [Chitinivibrio alkaliphilus]ERP32039.1 ABC-type metal ion transport system, periplasmic component/surface adhesin [Chitinivibrio alkaliphilus ACht1]
MTKQIALFLLCFIISGFGRDLTIGVALHPYYSFVKNIVQDEASVVTVTDGSNPHAYQATARDIMRLDSVDVLVLNGIGHDDFVEDMLSASGRADEITLIYANDNVPLIPESVGSERLNSHTFVSISSSISQIYHIANELAQLMPEQESTFRQNAGEYARRLRSLKFSYLEKLSDIETGDIRCATTHGGYSYLLQEFGVTVNAVLEPGHGLNPTATQMRQVIEMIQEKNIEILFSEHDYDDPFVRVLKEETDIRAIPLSHLSYGEYTAEHFETWMEFNLGQIVKALRGEADHE